MNPHPHENALTPHPQISNTPPHPPPQRSALRSWRRFIITIPSRPHGLGSSLEPYPHHPRYLTAHSHNPSAQFLANKFSDWKTFFRFQSPALPAKFTCFGAMICVSHPTIPSSSCAPEDCRGAPPFTLVVNAATRHHPLHGHPYTRTSGNTSVFVVLVFSSGVQQPGRPTRRELKR